MQSFESFVQYFSQQSIPYVLFKETYLLPGELVSDHDSLLSFSLPLGEQRRNTFIPSFILLERLLAHTNRFAIVNERSAWLFLCKKNVLKEGIVEKGVDEGFVLVLNERREVLGYGKITGAGITNLRDRGDFLRRER